MEYWTPNSGRLGPVKPRPRAPVAGRVRPGGRGLLWLRLAPGACGKHPAGPGPAFPDCLQPVLRMWQSACRAGSRPEARRRAVQTLAVEKPGQCRPTVAVTNIIRRGDRVIPVA